MAQLAPIDDAIDRAKGILMRAVQEARAVILASLSGHTITDAPFGMEVEAEGDTDWNSISLQATALIRWQPDDENGAHLEDGVDLSALEKSWPSPQASNGGPDGTPPALSNR